MLRFCSQTSQDSAARFTTASCPSVLFCTLIGNQVEAEAGSTQDPPISPAVISLIVASCWTERLSRSCLPSNGEFLIFLLQTRHLKLCVIVESVLWRLHIAQRILGVSSLVLILDS